jgi:hypothetical protein
MEHSAMTAKERIADAEARLEAAMKLAKGGPHEDIVAPLVRDVLSSLRGERVATIADKKRQRLIDLAHDWQRQHGAPPTAKDWKLVTGTKWPSYLTCIRAFGSWDDFILECGWEPRGRGRPIR